MCVTFLVPNSGACIIACYIYVCPNKGPEPLYVTFLVANVGPRSLNVTFLAPSVGPVVIVCYSKKVCFEFFLELLYDNQLWTSVGREFRILGLGRCKR